MAQSSKVDWPECDEAALAAGPRQPASSGMRRLRRSPGFALTAAATLAAGIAATITMFGVYAGVDLNPVTVADPASLLTIYGLNPHLRGSPDSYVSWPRFRDLQAKTTAYVRSEERRVGKECRS